VSRRYGNPIGWKFSDPPNVAVIASRAIIDDGDWIARVFHDEDDGAWQFHNREEPNASEAAIVGLQEICELDSSVEELADLPLGWFAWREAKHSPWKRGLKQRER
jgi:hypothetical protein